MNEQTVTLTLDEFQKLKNPKPSLPKFQPVNPIEGEIWRIVPNTNDLYSISNLGRLRKTFTSKFGIERDYLLSNKVRTAGCTVKLSVSPTYHINTYIHKLVLETFSPLPEGSGKMAIIHLDCDTGNNHLDNLKYGTHGEALAHKRNCGIIKPKLKTREYITKRGKKRIKQVWFSQGDIQAMRRLNAEGVSQAGIAAQFQCSQTFISKVINQKLRVD